MEDYLMTGLVGAGTAAISTLVTWLTTRRQYMADVKKRETEAEENYIGNIQRTMDFYQKLCDDTNERLQRVLEDNAKLRMEVDTLKTNQLKLMTEIRRLKNEND